MHTLRPAPELPRCAAVSMAAVYAWASLSAPVRPHRQRAQHEPRRSLPLQDEAEGRVDQRLLTSSQNDIEDARPTDASGAQSPALVILLSLQAGRRQTSIPVGRPAVLKRHRAWRFIPQRLYEGNPKHPNLRAILQRSAVARFASASSNLCLPGASPIEQM